MARGDAPDTADTAETDRLGSTMKDEPEAISNETKQPEESQTNPEPNLPFRKWMDSFRTRKRIPPAIPERFVEGWPDSSQSDISTQGLFPPPPLSHEHWERLSSHSSHLGMVKTMTLSSGSQSMARSRTNTQSTTNQSATSEMRLSGESSRPTASNYVDEAASQRATKRRQLLREVVSTEADYVQGLAALAGVKSHFNSYSPD